VISYIIDMSGNYDDDDVNSMLTRGLAYCAKSISFADDSENFLAILETISQDFSPDYDVIMPIAKERTANVLTDDISAIVDNTEDTRQMDTWLHESVDVAKQFGIEDRVEEAVRSVKRRMHEIDSWEPDEDDLENLKSEGASKRTGPTKQRYHRLRCPARSSEVPLITCLISCVEVFSISSGP
jgi:hypothetical protein